ncbi:MAG: DUF4153 domain-containing protein [Sphingomicrobium sp.]
MDIREDDADRWPLRPWIMAAICAAAGLLFDALTDFPSSGLPRPGQLAFATFTAVAALSFVITVEKRRWWWSVAFAIGWATVVALVGWFTARYNSRPTIFEWPFFSGLFAVLLAAPLFQTIRDEGAWRFPYPRLHRHVWVDAVIGGASLIFTGLSFLLALLIAGLFHLIGIKIFTDLLKESAFAWALAGFAFGTAFGLLRERDGLASILYRLVTMVLSVLAPVLAGALVLFLLSLPVTGLKELWDSSVPATPMLLLAGAAAFALTNAVIGDGTEERGKHRLLHWSALALSLTVLPLAIVAAVSIAQRIGQYGWTPERIWGVLAVAVAMAYGIAGWWSAFRGRVGFDQLLRPLQTKLAIGLCALALLLALPILDFGAISARSQVARFAAGRIPAKDFDWRAMAFDFGPSGRERLQEVAKTGSSGQRKLASAALASKNRYEVVEEVEKTKSAANLDTRLRIVPDGTILPPGLRAAIAGTRYCRFGPCVVTLVDDRRAVIAGPLFDTDMVEASEIKRDVEGVWSQSDILDSPALKPRPSPDLATAPVEVRIVQRRQLFIDGKPIGNAFE